MTRNSRKKMSLSVKKFISKKKQQGGGYGITGITGTTGMYVPNNQHFTSGAMRAQDVAQGITDANKLSTVNIKHMLKDVSSGGGEYSRILYDQHDLRTKYISGLNASNASTSNIQNTVNEIKPKYNEYRTLILRYRREGSGKTTPSMYSVEVIEQLNKLRIQLLLDLNNILKKEIEELESLCRNYHG